MVNRIKEYKIKGEKMGECMEKKEMMEKGRMFPPERGEIPPKYYEITFVYRCAGIYNILGGKVLI